MAGYQLGGNDIDKLLFLHCTKIYESETGADLSNDIDARERLLKECERAKIELSRLHVTSFSIITAGN